MKKLIIGVIVLAVLVGAAVVGLMMVKNNDNTTKLNESMGVSQEHTNTSHRDTSSDSTSDSSASSSSTEQTTSVAIRNFAYTPANITVKKGTTVTWTNEDDVKHNATSDQDGGPKGSLLAKGQSYTFTFEKAGTFNYYCTPHPDMQGTVTVTE